MINVRLHSSSSMKTIEDVMLIKRSTLFGNPMRAAGQLSPDGRYLSFAAPVDGVMNLWLAEMANRDAARAVTFDRGRGIRGGHWAYDSKHLIYSQDSNGDEYFHLYALNVETGEIKDLTPFDKVRVTVVETSRLQHLRDKVLIEVYQRDPRFGDLYTVSISTGELSLVRENPGFTYFVVNEGFEVVLAMQSQQDTSEMYLRPVGEGWEPWLTFGPDDVHCSGVSHVDAASENVYLIDSRGRDTGALVRIPLSAPDRNAAPVTVIAESAKVDVSGGLLNQVTLEPMTVTVNHHRREVQVVDPTIQEDVTFLSARFPEWRVTSRTEDDRLWLVVETSDTVPADTYLYNRATRELTRLFASRPDLVGLPLARMQPLSIPTPDGFDLVCYLTLPVFADDRAHPLSSSERLPMVLLVHGGPWARDEFGFNSTAQWLANRGYAVLSVNFRGSTGFGKKFSAASDKEWGGKMDDDLSTAVQWAIDRRIADPDRIAVMGGSYGGYAALWALTQHADKYACGVDIVGPSNLETLLASTPAYWESFRAKLHAAIGDPSTDDGLKLLRERSPLTYVARIQKPLLIGQGANDPRVKQAESDQMVAAMAQRGIPYTYVLFPDEGHGFQRPANQIKFNVITESFLARYLGGRVQAEEPGECDGNTAVIAIGA